MPKKPSTKQEIKKEIKAEPRKAEAAAKVEPGSEAEAKAPGAGVFAPAPGADHNSRGRGRSNAEKGASRASYRNRKNAVRELERENYKHILLFRALDYDTNRVKFHLMGWNSALIYAGWACKLIKDKKGRPKSYSLRHDREFDVVNSRVGLCYITDLDQLTRQFAEIGVKRVDLPLPIEGVIAFETPREFDQYELDSFYKTEQEKAEQLNELVATHNLHPELYGRILKLETEAMKRIKAMHTVERDLLGVRLIEMFLFLTGRYSEMVNADPTEEKKYLKKMLVGSDSLSAMISILYESKIWDINDCLKLASLNADVRDTLSGLLKEDNAAKI